ncbi:TRAP transporter small permease [Roseibium sp. CAU 1637]|uniref:TRAP transporter small permease protein n=1 Tax=Roseibium limicola TaxID=2816037 RepID=A0A939J7N5_9HYPH|nr:TRAP transporter small permease [Roseibium limicola]MBO0343989.1 TRAP transporter small permease [Roseibium limicola]
MSHSTGAVARALNALSNLCLLASSCSLVLLVVVFGWLVFGRYVLNVTPTWVEQLSLLLVGYITFVGSATVVHEDSHLGVTLFRDMLGSPGREIATALADFILAGFGLVMAFACIDLMQFGWSTKLPMLNVPESLRTLPAFLCGAFTFVFAGARGGRQILLLLSSSDTHENRSL